MSEEISKPTATICCIARHEESYVHEWIQYHLFLGFDCIQIHDNSDNNALKDLDRAYDGKVEIVHFPGETQQYPAYNDLLVRSKKRFTFGTFIDCDEFIVLRKDKSIIDFLVRHNPEAGITLNWVFFGSNFRNFKDEKPVLQRFVRRQRGVDPHVKSIVRLDNIDEYSLSHFPTIKRGNMIDTNGSIVEGPFNANGDDSDAAIFHFWTKSKEEYLFKGSKPRPDTKDNREGRIDAYFYNNARANELTDYTALEFFLKHAGQNEMPLELIKLEEESPRTLAVSELISWLLKGNAPFQQTEQWWFREHQTETMRRLKESIIGLQSELKNRQLSPQREHHEHEVIKLKNDLIEEAKERKYLQNLVDSAYAFQRLPWYRRAFSRWRGMKRPS